MTAWLVVHVLAAIFGIGPEIAFGVMGPRARRAGATSARDVYEAIAAARARIVYPALVVQVASGTALILLGHHSIIHERWLGSALGMYVVAILIVGAVLAPGSAKARRLLADGKDPKDEKLRALWARQAAAGSVAGSLLIAVAVLMVWKP